MSNEADTSRKYVLPRLYKSGWSDDQINEQRYFTDGRIVAFAQSLTFQTRHKRVYKLLDKGQRFLHII